MSSITFATTNRGFSIARFTDRYGAECSLQKSSLATEDCIWFGCGDNRMHLTQEHVSALLPALQHFAETGELPVTTDTDGGGTMTNLYGNSFRAGFHGGSFNRCSHGYTGFQGHCWRCGIFHPIRFLRDLWQDLRA